MCDMLSTFFVENLVVNLLYQSRHVQSDAQVRWFVRVLNKWNVEKTHFKPANESVEAGFSLRILLFVLIMT